LARTKGGAVAGKAGAVKPGILIAAFGFAIFLSASLLFSVQPLFAKVVLPSLGGSPSVWSVALVFFQGTLLAGYLYAHLLTRYLPGKPSVLAHLFVMTVAVLALPLGIASGWGRPPTQGAEFWLLALFAASIGLPFFALSANAPLLQAWFARTGHPSAKDPYFLYAASNIGSFLSLLSYPFVVEPFTRLSEQTNIWSALFIFLIVAIAFCGVLLLRTRNELPAANSRRDAAPSRRDALIWIALGAVPSAYLVAVTAHISTDVAAVPLLWVMPLALFLLTFVIAFQTRPIIPHSFFLMIQPAVVALLVASLVFSQLQSIFTAIGVNLAAFFVTAMVCHGELARRRPAARHLTAFYLCMATGGVIGGVLAGLIAPYVFSWVAEYPLLIVAGLLCRPGLALPDDGRAWVWNNVALAAVAVAVVCTRYLGLYPNAMTFQGLIGVALILTVLFLANNTLRLAGAIASILILIYAYQADGSDVLSVRSFFGVHRVYERDAGDVRMRLLMHGTTVHGAQIVGPGGKSEDGRPATVTYFGPRSPMAVAFEGVKENKRGPIRVAVVGLGAGTVACFLRKTDHLDFYEIDDAVVQIAFDPKQFEFISGCKPDARVVLGDARLTLADAPDGSYDLIVMDAFSSDAVPVHLLTREAMALYLRKLAPGGIVVSHVMNRHLELASVVAGIGDANGMVTRVMSTTYDGTERHLYGSTVAAVARRDADFGALLRLGEWEPQAPDPKQWVWTDDYSNIVGAMIRHMD
jgi:SAM-dependent methyltransferase